MSAHQRAFQPAPLAREMTIEQALHWAFAAEKAQLDFDQYGAHEFDRMGVDPLWRGIQMHKLGCAVDGGGSSDPHPDAAIIAAAVETLPVGCGGQRMAIQIAELARARRAPDWGQGARLTCVPADSFGMCERDLFLTGHVVKRGGSLWAWRDDRYRKHQRLGDMCRVEYTGTAASLAAKRRAYLAWYGALLWLLGELSRPGALMAVQVVDGLPVMAPWED